MAGSRTRVFTIVCEAPKGVSTAQLKLEMANAIRCIGDTYHSQDPMFEFGYRSKFAITAVKLKPPPQGY